jgi:hypothetical protein
MSQLNKKFLISGCGLSWSGQERKTWVNILKASGLKITDVGGPAVSNQWILNKVILELLKNDYDTVIIQLTSLGKLDIEINEERIQELVVSDSLRNFTYKNIWPSSVSDEHESKKQYYKWLMSPTLEMDDIVVKLVLLNELCTQRKINLFVFQGYDIPWTEEQKKLVHKIIVDQPSLYNAYPNSVHYKFHDYTNSVPCLSYQFVIAKLISTYCCHYIIPKIDMILAKSDNVVVE